MALEVAYIAMTMKEGPRNGMLDMTRRAAGLTAIIARLYSLKGMGGDKERLAEEIGLAVKELEKEVAMKYPFMTMAEVRYALECGVKGELDSEPTYLSVANYCRWLSIYRHSQARLEAFQAVQNGIRMAPPTMQLSAGTIETRNEEALKKLEEAVRKEIAETGRISPDHTDATVAGLYDYFRKARGMERPDPREIQEAMSAVSKMVRPGEQAGRTATRAKRILLTNYIANGR